ncbi:metallophosphoesterase [Pseudonocardia eucalypti]|uniref:Metallophosphoesterase n=2 Tax=Pseudonocardia eucalypti TaxID=648755 RepID=A0ABP9PT85_9PSEU
MMAATVVVLLHAYLYFRLVRDVLPERRWRLVGLLVLVLLAFSTVAAVAVGREIRPELGIPLSWAGYLWIVFGLYTALALLVLELPRALLRRRLDPSRRTALARLLTGAAALFAAGTVGFGVTQARRPRLVRREITLDRLDPALDGMTIAALSDVHVGTINRRPFLRDVVTQVNDARPDLVAIVGDLVDGSVEQLGDIVEALSGLDAPAFFVTGNHEYFSGADDWCEFLTGIGVRVLRNERVAVGRRGAPPGSATLDLAGIDDRTAARSGEAGHAPNLAGALAGRDESRPVVLLAHQPVMVDQAAGRGVDLQISGHTHGGQFLPMGYVVLLDQPVLAGLTRVGRTWLYVTRGVGFWGPPVRVGAPPEITLLTLRAP